MIQQNLISLYEKIDTLANQCGRNRDDIKLVAVSKRFPLEAIQEACLAGQRHFGENYVQEAQAKQPHLEKNVQLHFIGHLQSNKAKIAARIFSMIETVDSLKLAMALNRQCQAIDKKLDILIQVNIAEEQQKSGVRMADAALLVDEISSLNMLQVRGLMTMPPFSTNPENGRPFFRKLRLLAQSIGDKKLFYDNDRIELSMGMSSDYHIAIEEGATLVRVGTAIFGERPPKTD